MPGPADRGRPRPLLVAARGLGVLATSIWFALLLTPGPTGPDAADMVLFVLAAALLAAILE